MKTICCAPRLIIFACLLACLAAHQPAVAQKSPPADGPLKQVTVPLIVEGNRPLIDVTFRRPDGSKRSARFLIDSGGGAFIITEPLARDIGLKWGATEREDGDEFASPTEPVKAFVDNFELNLDQSRVLVVIGTDSVLPKSVSLKPEGLFPGHVLAHYHVVFDYPNGKFTLAQAGVLTPKGTPLPMPVNQRSGFPRTEIEVDGKTYGFLIDTGASFTMVSEVLLKSWGTDHTDWPRYPGAYGEAATLGGTTLETMFVPGGRWGPNQLKEFGVTSQRQGAFERRMSSMMAAPIIGSLAGNVLKRFRLDMDYPNTKLYLSGP